MFSLRSLLFFLLNLNFRKAYYSVLFARFMPVGVIVYNFQEDRFVFANRYFCNSLHMTEEQLINKRSEWIDLVADEHKEETKETARNKVWDDGYLGLFINSWIDQKTKEPKKMTWTALKINKVEILGYVQFDTDSIHDFLDKKQSS